MILIEIKMELIKVCNSIEKGINQRFKGNNNIERSNNESASFHVAYQFQIFSGGTGLFFNAFSNFKRC